MRKLKRCWEWMSHGDTMWGVMNIIFPSLGGTGGGIISSVTSLHPVIIFFSILGGLALGLFISNEIAARRIRKHIGVQPPEATTPQVVSTWLEQELSSDLQRISEAMRGRVTHWDFSAIYNREPYFDVFVELTNTTIFTFILRRLSGIMKIAEEPCANPPQVSTRFGIKRDKPTDIRVRQHIAPETVAIIQDAGNSNKEIQFHLGEVVFEIENATNGYEQYKPYLTGGIHDIVPKDGLKLEPLRQQSTSQIKFDVAKLLLDGKEILVDLEKMNGQLDAAGAASAELKFEIWYKDVSKTLQNTDYDRLWFENKEGLDYRKAKKSDYIETCKYGLDRLENIKQLMFDRGDSQT